LALRLVSMRGETMPEKDLWDAVLALAVADAYGAFKTNQSLDAQEVQFIKSLKRLKSKGHDKHSTFVKRICAPESLQDHRGKEVRDGRIYFHSNGDIYKDLTVICERANVCPKRMRESMVKIIADIRAREDRLLQQFQEM